MDLTGDTRVAAPPAAVWAALIDPDLLCRLIPGCEAMTGDPERGYDITVARTLAGMTARLSGRIDMTEVAPAQGCLLHAQGTGGAAGLARGTARIALLPEGEGTRLSWVIAAEVGGRLGALPVFVVDAAARRLAAAFAERFCAEVEGRPSRGWLGRLTGA